MEHTALLATDLQSEKPKPQKNLEVYIHDSWQEVFGRVSEALGGIIVSWHEPLQIGEALAAVGTPGFAEDMTDQPFVIVGEATLEQFNRQCAFVAEAYDLTYEADDDGEGYYYFVQTD